MRRAQQEIARRGWARTTEDTNALLGRTDVILIDLREREKFGTIPGSFHVPYRDLADNLKRGGMLHELAKVTGKRLVFYCAYGERSAMAVTAVQEAGLVSTFHLEGGLVAWRKVSGRITL